ncbi:hypothetical protein PM02_16625 [Sulfitobacter mediterraneus]|uniref:Uncharacterized protein n=1 Tax=Sulfitobacter mediterraneus TaxID=83219 RepID=A0A061SRE8_9RHOB|nr:hypothetical protein PM02_16625 [Sulfitobacter mediterraneus]
MVVAVAQAQAAVAQVVVAQVAVAVAQVVVAQVAVAVAQVAGLWPLIRPVLTLHHRQQAQRKRGLRARPIIQVKYRSAQMPMPPTQTKRL